MISNYHPVDLTCFLLQWHPLQSQAENNARMFAKASLLD